MIMKFAKLLGVGNSFFGGNQAVAYRLNKFVLPKFNDGKNPFAPKADAEAPVPAAPVAAKVENKIPAPTKFAAPVFAKAPAPKPAAPVVLPMAASPKPPRPAWTARLNPFRAAEPVAEQPAVTQTELSLDAVKVVYNDLTDADVDVVPAKSHNAPIAVPNLAPARQAWEYLGESVLKS